MNSEKSVGKQNYCIVGIGDPGEYVMENISSSFEDNALLSVHTYRKISEFRMEDVMITEQSKALFLVLQPGDRASDQFIPQLESFRQKTGIHIYTIANYPFLWEGRVRITQADDL